MHNGTFLGFAIVSCCGGGDESVVLFATAVHREKIEPYLLLDAAPSQRACNLTFAYCFGCYRKHSKHIQFARMSATYALLPYPSRINRTRIALYALFNRHNLRNDYNLKMTYQIFSS